MCVCAFQFSCLVVRLLACVRGCVCVLEFARLCVCVSVLVGVYAGLVVCVWLRCLRVLT